VLKNKFEKDFKNKQLFANKQKQKLYSIILFDAVKLLLFELSIL
jgi:hypothetical protein